MEIEKKVVKRDLDFSRTKDYFLDHIDGGGVLEKVCIQNIQFEEGSFFILLPEAANIESLYQFATGGINPAVSTNQVHYTKSGREFIPQKRITTSREVSQFIETFLKQSDDHFAVCEDLIQHAEDPPQLIPNVAIHFHNNLVYYSLCNKNSLEEIDQAITRTDHIWHSLVVLAVVSKLPHRLQLEDFSSICANAQFVLTSAHDGENYVVWKAPNI